ncbi:hypothetical protein ACP70R_041770 [Stipagrostis hirtigluma subsp. patula]
MALPKLAMAILVAHLTFAVVHADHHSKPHHFATLAHRSDSMVANTSRFILRAHDLSSTLGVAGGVYKDSSSIDPLTARSPEHLVDIKANLGAWKERVDGDDVDIGFVTSFNGDHSGHRPVQPSWRGDGINAGESGTCIVQAKKLAKPPHFVNLVSTAMATAVIRRTQQRAGFLPFLMLTVGTMPVAGSAAPAPPRARPTNEVRATVPPPPPQPASPEFAPARTWDYVWPALAVLGAVLAVAGAVCLWRRCCARRANADGMA